MRSLRRCAAPHPTNRPSAPRHIRKAVEFENGPTPTDTRSRNRGRIRTDIRTGLPRRKLTRRPRHDATVVAAAVCRWPFQLRTATLPVRTWLIRTSCPGWGLRPSCRRRHRWRRGVGRRLGSSRNSRSPGRIWSAMICCPTVYCSCEVRGRTICRPGRAHGRPCSVLHRVSRCALITQWCWISTVLRVCGSKFAPVQRNPQCGGRTSGQRGPECTRLVIFPPPPIFAGSGPGFRGHAMRRVSIRLPSWRPVQRKRGEGEGEHPPAARAAAEQFHTRVSTGRT